jgi:mono/diheme cytochrome c family protein
MRLVLAVVLLGTVACGEKSSDPDRVTAILDLTGDSANGELVYADNCATCHGLNGEGGSGPSMASAVGEGDQEIVDVILSGEDSMPAFDSLPDQDIADVLAWITENF